MIPLSDTEYSVIPISACLELRFSILRDFLLLKDDDLRDSFFALFRWDLLFCNFKSLSSVGSAMEEIKLAKDGPLLGITLDIWPILDGFWILSRPVINIYYLGRSLKIEVAFRLEQVFY
jgi:hypothetical protein